MQPCELLRLSDGAAHVRCPGVEPGTIFARGLDEDRFRITDFRQSRRCTAGTGLPRSGSTGVLPGVLPGVPYVVT